MSGAGRKVVHRRQVPLPVGVRQFNAYSPAILADSCRICAGEPSGVKTGQRPPRRGVVLTLAAAGGEWAAGTGWGTNQVMGSSGGGLGGIGMRGWGGRPALPRCAEPYWLVPAT